MTFSGDQCSGLLIPTMRSTFDAGQQRGPLVEHDAELGHATNLQSSASWMKCPRNLTPNRISALLSAAARWSRRLSWFFRQHPVVLAPERLHDWRTCRLILRKRGCAVDRKAIDAMRQRINRLPKNKLDA